MSSWHLELPSLFVEGALISRYTTLKVNLNEINFIMDTALFSSEASSIPQKLDPRLTFPTCGL